MQLVKVQPPFEQPLSLPAQPFLMLAELVYQRRRRPWTKAFVQRLRIFRHLQPFPSHVERNFQMKLHTVGAGAPSKGLVGESWRARQQNRSRWQRERIAVPLESQHFSRNAAEDGIACRLRREKNRKQANLGFRALEDDTPKAGRQQLRAEAGAEERHACPNRIVYQCFFIAKPGQFFLVVDAHRPAHGDDRFEAVPVGQWVMLVKFDAMNGGAALTQHILVNSGRLARDMLKYQDVHDIALIA